MMMSNRGEERMLKYLVSVNEEPATECDVQIRTPRIVPGVLVDVAIRGEFQLCMVTRVDSLIITVAQLPHPA